ncbi:FMN-dependent NADH-azoreductase [Tumebacillus algifaecis]|uniref:FMN dependent NADH:quinone oxidoreductase n=1 Tax=Tumebacillus algifaecis TaxID=1214604 RepID=A0A223CXS8_9BACL|nr:FMN-dependent NADH-azoreductase [Tumebacillus algifaecis]ASS74180.1 FMN-dependent NADH-azoreductase [Tumebacillus algifaecis]
MATVLYITVNPKAEEESFSLSVGREFVNAYREANPNDEVIELDLYKTNIPLIDPDVFSGWGKLQSGAAFDALSSEEQAKVARLNELADQFVAADKYVFVTPMWNLSYPPLLKAYIDAFCVAGKTFRYTEQGPQGLMGGKKALHIQARGGFYSEGPAADFEFGDRYLRAILAFVGITDTTTLAIEGMAAQPDNAGRIKEDAIVKAQELAKTFN